MKQRFTSKQTSINSTKAPAVYSMKRAVDVMTGKIVVDIGGGRFDTAAEAARVYGAAVSIYDPFNRTPEHNAAVLAGSSTAKPPGVMWYGSPPRKPPPF